MPKKLKLAATIISLVLILAFASGALGITGNEQIWTDKPDYGPNETVIISGSGFEPFLLLTIKITLPDNSIFINNLITGATGNFTYNYTLDGINGTYLVEAIEQATGTVLAITTFTESPGAIWTTDTIHFPQDNHHFFTGGSVWTHGDGLDINATLNYKITDGTGANAPVVKTGQVITNAQGTIIPDPTLVWDIPLNYIIQGNHQFKITVYSTPAKSDNFAVDYGPWPPLILTPPTDTNLAGTQHTVTVTANDIFGNPVAGVKIYFNVTGVNPNFGWAPSPGTTWAASTPTDANGQTTYTYIGNIIGTDTITATADSDNSGVAEIDEPSGTATKEWQALYAFDLDPAFDINNVGSQHTVIATLTDKLGSPVAGKTVYFTVSGANPTSGSGVTNVSGQATFSYTGTNPSQDTINAWADIDGNGSKEAGDPSASAVKVWQEFPPTGLNTYWLAVSALMAMALGVLIMRRNFFQNLKS